MIQPEVPYPLGQVANTGADNGSLSVSEAMEHQSIPEMTYMNGSPSMPSSALERCALTAWSGLVHVTDHDDHCPLGLASNPTGHVSSRESVGHWVTYTLDSWNNVLSDRLWVPQKMQKSHGEHRSPKSPNLSFVKPTQSRLLSYRCWCRSNGAKFRNGGTPREQAT